MKCDKKAMLLYAVTDQAWTGKQTLMEQVEDALKGGATCMQLREKKLDKEAFLKEAMEMKTLCNEFHVPFIVNDEVEIAVQCGADGIHVGQKDMEAGNVRAIVGENMIIGVSAQTVEQAVAAEKAGADYLGVGAVFNTSTKLDASEVSFNTLKEICEAVSIPVVAIGGITKNNVQQLKGSGICGISVISAIFSQKDIKSATMELRKNTEEMLKD